MFVETLAPPEARRRVWLLYLEEVGGSSIFPWSAGRCHNCFEFEAEQATTFELHYSPRNRRTKTGSSATLKSETKAATAPSQTLCITSFSLFYLLPLLDINFISWFGNKTPRPSTVCDLYMLFLRFLYSLLICHDILWYIFTCGKHNLAFL